MSALELAASALLTLLLQSTLLLGAVWAAERLRLLRDPGHAELARRGALFAALLATTLQVGGWLRAEVPAIAAMAPVAAPLPALAAEPDTASAPVVVHTNAAGARVAEARVAALPRLAASKPAAAPQPSLRVAAPARRFSDVPLPLALVALALWAAFVAVAAQRLLRQGVALRRLARAVARQGLPAPAALQQEAQALADLLELPAPTLRLLPDLASPLLLPGATLLLPDWTPTLPPAQRRALLAHEFAHLQRRDPAWRLAVRIAVLPLALQPLAKHAVQRLDALAEDACDARAALLLGSGRPLAECLAACLSRVERPLAAPALAVAMAGEPGAVVRRVSNLLKESAMSIRPVSPALRRGAIVAAVVAALALPGLAITLASNDAIASAFTDALDSGVNQQTFRQTDDDGSLLFQLRGEATFNADESDVATLSADGRLTIEIDRDGTTRWLRIENRDGAIVRTFKVDGDERPFAGEGSAWLAQQLPQLLRETGIDAEARGKRILAAGGVPALFAEIAQIHGDYARRAYLEVLFRNARLDDAQLRQSLQLTAAIEADFEKRQSLQTALETQRPGDAVQSTLLQTAATIESDFELAETLVTFADTQRIASPALPDWGKALATIDSDFEKGRVLEALLDQAGGDAVIVALDGVAAMDSDFERRGVLEAAVPHVDGDATLRAAWLHQADRLDSAFEHREALIALLDHSNVDVALADGVLQSVRGIDSDFEARQVLEALAEKMPADAGLIERYRAVARGFGDFERGEAEKALDRFAAN